MKPEGEGLYSSEGPSSGAATVLYPTPPTNVLSLTKMHQEARCALIELLDSVKGKKVLVMDPKLSGPLGQICRDDIAERTWDQGSLENASIADHYRVELTKYVAENIENHKREGQSKEYHVYFVPRSTTICVSLLEEHGVDNVIAVITIGEYPLDLIPYDEDVLSLELESTYRECFLQGDHSSLYYVARSIMKVQTTFGIIPKITWKGNASRLVADMLGRMRNEFEDELTNPSDIDQIIIIDRQVDLITPLITPLTYEGLIDEIFGIHNSVMEIDSDIIGSKSTENASSANIQKKKISLNSGDKVFSLVRDLHLNRVGSVLNQKVKDIDAFYKQRHNNLTPSQLKDFAKRFPAAQRDSLSVSTHTDIAAKIQKIVRAPSFLSRLEAEVELVADGNPVDDYIEECIDKREPLVRLLCLCSLVNDGLKTKKFEHYRSGIIQSYGFEHILTLDNLERLGLFKKQDGRNIFPTLRKNFNVYNEDFDENEPVDLHFAHSGYAPLSIRFIQNSFESNWEERDDLLGPQGRTVQTCSGAEGSKKCGSRMTMVYFVGGVTFAEISLLRWLRSLYGEFIIATTELINGDGFVQSIGENMKPPTAPFQPSEKK
ncbi:vacuolar protein sorting 33A [Planoprotostelium fungivorum]|uniref:Vacuolar protein sorting 33A n=1 Tax=Planoprotostelium fungivorum TaxID=1890364 RepID=A0A2P6N803_9EUKA|nr:vacuolar protein sorting 33A [Planoprotostelium fungivorum]